MRGRLVTGRSSLLPWARHQEGGAGHSNHGTLYAGKPGAGKREIEVRERIEESWLRQESGPTHWRNQIKWNG